MEKFSKHLPKPIMEELPYGLGDRVEFNKEEF